MGGINVTEINFESCSFIDDIYNYTKSLYVMVMLTGSRWRGCQKRSLIGYLQRGRGGDEGDAQ